jgi:hypothetical protein
VAASGPLDRLSLLFGIKQQFQIVNIRLATKERRAKLFVVCVCSQGWGTAKTRPASHPALVRTGKHVPVGCDRASSSMSSPQFSSLFGLFGVVERRPTRPTLVRDPIILMKFGTFARYSRSLAARPPLGSALNRNDQYLSHAADCHLMACMTRDQHERQTWLDMAQSWLRLVQMPTRPSISSLDRSPSLSRSGPISAAWLNPIARWKAESHDGGLRYCKR